MLVPTFPLVKNGSMFELKNVTMLSYNVVCIQHYNWKI
jgi:hypothetical protein